MSLFSTLSPPEAMRDAFVGLPYLMALRNERAPPAAAAKRSSADAPMVSVGGVVGATKKNRRHVHGSKGANSGAAAQAGPAPVPAAPAPPPARRPAAATRMFQQLFQPRPPPSLPGPEQPLTQPLQQQQQQQQPQHHSSASEEAPHPHSDRPESSNASRLSSVLGLAATSSAAAFARNESSMSEGSSVPSSLLSSAAPSGMPSPASGGHPSFASRLPSFVSSSVPSSLTGAGTMMAGASRDDGAAEELSGWNDNAPTDAGDDLLTSSSAAQMERLLALKSMRGVVSVEPPSLPQSKRASSRGLGSLMTPPPALLIPSNGSQTARALSTSFSKRHDNVHGSGSATSRQAHSRTEEKDAAPSFFASPVAAAPVGSSKPLTSLFMLPPGGSGGGDSAWFGDGPPPRTMEDELLELQNERRARDKKARQEQDDADAEQQQEQKDASGGVLPRHKTVRFPTLPGSSAARGMDPRALASHQRALALLAAEVGIVLPSLPTSGGTTGGMLLGGQGKGNSSSAALTVPDAHVLIDSASHVEMYKSKLASYTHRLTRALQANLERVRTAMRANEQTRLRETRRALRETLRFYHAHEGPMYDACAQAKEGARELSLLEHEQEELRKQQQLIDEDYRTQHAALLAQLTHLHARALEGKSAAQVAEYLAAPALDAEGKPIIKVPSRRPSKTGSTLSASPPSGRPVVSRQPSLPLDSLDENGGTLDGTANVTAAAGEDDRLAHHRRHHSSGSLSLAHPPPSSSSPARSPMRSRTNSTSGVAGSSVGDLSLKLGVLRQYWQSQFAVVRRERDTLSSLRSTLISAEQELGQQVAMERMQVEGLSAQLAQMQVNHDEQLAVRAKEARQLDDEYAKNEAKRAALQAELDELVRAAEAATAEEEQAWSSTQSLQSARLELSAANEAVAADLEFQHYESLRAKQAAAELSASAFADVLEGVRQCIACPQCGYEIAAASFVWATGDTLCEKCAFQKLFPQNFQSVVRAMHKMVITTQQAQQQQVQAASSAAASVSASPSFPAASLTQRDLFGPSSELGQSLAATSSVSASVAHAQRKQAAREMLLDEAGPGVKIHLESSAKLTGAAAIEAAGLEDLGARLLENMTLVTGAAAGDDGTASADGSSSRGSGGLLDSMAHVSANVGHRIRRGSLGGLVDAYTAMNQAALSASPSSDSLQGKGQSMASSSPQTRSSHRLLGELSEVNSAAALGLTATPEGGGEEGKDGGVMSANGVPFALLWLKNRVADQFVSRWSAYRARMSEVMLGARALPAVLAEFEQSLSLKHRERMAAVRGEQAPSLHQQLQQQSQQPSSSSQPSHPHAKPVATLEATGGALTSDTGAGAASASVLTHIPPPSGPSANSAAVRHLKAVRSQRGSL